MKRSRFLAAAILGLIPAVASGQLPLPLSSEDLLAILSDASLIGLRIEGPSQVDEETLTLYQVIAEFDNGWEFEVTLDSALWLEPGLNATIGVFGDFDALDVAGDQIETINAYYSFGPDAETATLDVTIIDLPPAKHALDFDGLDDLVIVPRSDSLEPPEELTVECWANGLPGNDTDAVLVRKAEHYGAGFVLRWQYQGNQHIHFAVVKNGTSDRVAVDDPTPNTEYEGEWHQFAGVYSTSEDYARLYVDGVLVAEEPGFGALGHSAADLWMGKALGLSDEAFHGQIDEVRIWNIERTPQEICQNMHRRLNGDEAGLVGYWRFDEGQGQTAYDSSPNGNHGTLGANDDPGGDSADPAWVESEAEMVKGNIVAIEIEGPAEVPSGGQASYQALATYDEGQVDVAPCADWSIDPPEAGTFDEPGQLTAAEIGTEDLPATLFATYDEGTGPQIGQKDVTIATLTGPRYALEFDGSNDRLTVPRIPELEPTDELTVECWAMAQSGYESEARLIRKAGSFDAGYILAWQQSGAHVQLRLDKAGLSQQLIVADPTPNSEYLNQWHHFAGAYSAAEDFARLYVDGVLVAEKPGFGPLEHTPGDLYIGSSPYTSYETFSGHIDEVCIWNVARTQCEIRHNLHRQLRGDEPGLVGYWRFDEGQGQTAYDSSPFGNHGTLGVNDDPAGDASDPTWILSAAGINQPAFDPGEWTEGVRIDEVSSGADWAASVTGDELEMFIFSERDAFASTDIYVSTRSSVTDLWSTPVLVPELCIPGYINHDTTGGVSDDGLHIYFTRHYGYGPGDFYFAERPSRTSSWSTPVPIDSLNTADGEYGIDVTADELICVFGSDRSGSGRIYTASRTSMSDPWSNITLIPSLADFSAGRPTISSDGLTIFVTSSAAGGMGGGDIWRVTRASLADEFSEPVNVVILNSSTDEFHASLSASGETIYLARKDANAGSIYASYLQNPMPGSPPPDFDGDCDVDADDLDMFEACATGAAVPLADPDCGVADFDGDEDVDQSDFGILQRCNSGPVELADPNCAD